MRAIFVPFALLGLSTLLTGTPPAQDPHPGPSPLPAVSNNAVNLPPVCCVGPDCAQLGLVMIKKCEGDSTSFVLDATGSYDPEGQPVTFSWSASPNVTISNPFDAITTVTLDTSANCDQIEGVRLNVNDGEVSGLCRVYVQSISNAAICPTKPRQLEYTYVGAACSDSNYVQDPASVTCSGDAMYADPVHIVVSKANKPGDVYFNGIVALGQSFVEDGASFAGGKVAPNTRIQIYDLMGNLLQDTSFHTSCSQPLEVGDQFGASIITGFTW